MVVICHAQTETIHRDVIQIPHPEIGVQGAVLAEFFLVVIQTRRTVHDYAFSCLHEMTYSLVNERIFCIRQIKALGQDQEAVVVQRFFLEVLCEKGLVGESG